MRYRYNFYFLIKIHVCNSYLVNYKILHLSYYICYNRRVNNAIESTKNKKGY